MWASVIGWGGRGTRLKASWWNQKITAALLLLLCDVRTSSVSPSGLRETGLRGGVAVGGAGVVGEGEVWAVGTASTRAANATSTDTAAATNREWTG